jgi:long-chain acyl-CoA synthetase
MVINPFRPKPSDNPVEAPLQTSVTPFTIPEMAADAAARFGPNTAYQQKVEGQWHRVTFDGLWRQANDFAAGLIALGHQPGDRVAICAENSLPWLAGYLGNAIARGIGVPVYYDLKNAEIEEALRRSGARFLIASTKVLDKLGDHPAGIQHVIVIGTNAGKPGQPPRFLRRARPGLLPFDQVADQATAESRAALAQRPVEPDDVASIVFTSGTTGGMKGVMLTHKNFMSNLESIRRTIQFDERDRLVLVLPMHHAFPFIITLACMAFGGILTFENDLLRVRDRVKEAKPTIFLGVPALFEQMYRAIVRRAEAEGRLEMFQRGLRVVDVAKRRTGVNLGKLVFREVHQQLGGQLRFMLSGAAPLKPEVARNFFRLGLPLLQGWGLSEAAPVVATQRWVPRKFFFSNYYEEHVGTVGPPLAGVEVNLIDVPEKEIYVHLHHEGELVVRGPNVFPGYWQSPDETAAAKAGEWLRTGDLGRIDDEGNIWITGRSKYVIVLDSGEKVVPDELEEQMGRSELLADTCVLARRNRDKTQVGAIIYPDPETTLQRIKERGLPATEASVRTLVHEEMERTMRDLAPYKRISELILSDEPLPKTAIQKVIRYQLKETYTFDYTRWEQSTAALLAPPPPEETRQPSADGTDS